MIDRQELANRILRIMTNGENAADDAGNDEALESVRAHLDICRSRIVSLMDELDAEIAALG